jgi:hypothetical protein
LALCVRHRVSSSGIVPSRRYSKIGLHQSTSGLGGPIIAATPPSDPGLCSIGPTEASGLASNTDAKLLSPGRVNGVGTELPSSREVPGNCTRISSSSRIEGLNKSCVNTPGGGGSQLDPSRPSALAASLSHQRICVRVIYPGYHGSPVMAQKF